MLKGGIIIEGVSGAGKSTIITALLDHPQLKADKPEIFYEEETFGELMDEVKIPLAPGQEPAYRLFNLLEKLKLNSSKPGYSYLLERFHPSYYPFIKDWDQTFKAIDSQLQTCRGKIVALYYKDRLFGERAFNRVDRLDSGWAPGLVEYFGSKEKAIDAFIDSQNKRMGSLALSKLPKLLIDTSDRQWPVYVDKIVDFWLK